MSLTSPAVDEEVFQVAGSSKVESEMELDFAGLDIEEPGHAITVTTKKVAPPPPKRGHASSAATAAIAVR